MSDFQFKFPELFQFFGGYFYQGWSTDYRWETANPNFEAVVRHFRALNPPSTVNRVITELEQFIGLELDENDLEKILSELGNNYLPDAQTGYRCWLLKILEILRESSINVKILREKN